MGPLGLPLTLSAQAWPAAVSRRSSCLTGQDARVFSSCCWPFAPSPPLPFTHPPAWKARGPSSSSKAHSPGGWPPSRWSHLLLCQAFFLLAPFELLVAASLQSVGLQPCTQAAAKSCLFFELALGSSSPPASPVWLGGTISQPADFWMPCPPPLLSPSHLFQRVHIHETVHAAWLCSRSHASSLPSTTKAGRLKLDHKGLP